MAKKLKTFHIETRDGTGCFNFITQAEDSKKALRNLQLRSFDYKKLVKKDRELSINIKEV